MNRIEPPTSDAIKAAARHLQAGGVVAFPTETVYGLGANALDPLAVARIFELKGRPRFDPLIVHLGDAGQLAQVAREVSSAAHALIDQFWPGPLTLVLPKTSNVPEIVTSGLSSVAIRCPAHPVARQLIQAAGFPLAAPSANRFGKLSPTTARHVVESFGEEVPLVLDGGPCSVGVESTIVSLIHDPPLLLRPGGISREQLVAVLGNLVDSVPPQAGPCLAPGTLRSHYAPHTPLEIHASVPAPPPPGQRVGLLCVGPPIDDEGFAAKEILSRSGNLTEAAANLFAALRRLDHLNLDRIVAVACAPEGLGLAIMDRLTRAASPRDE